MIIEGPVLHAGWEHGWAWKQGNYGSLLSTLSLSLPVCVCVCVWVRWGRTRPLSSPALDGSLQHLHIYLAMKGERGLGHGCLRPSLWNHFPLEPLWDTNCGRGKMPQRIIVHWASDLFRSARTDRAPAQVPRLIEISSKTETPFCFSLRWR